MKKILIVSIYKLGDNIFLTPSLRKYKLNTDNYIGLCLSFPYRNTEFFDYNPYVNKIHYLYTVNLNKQLCYQNFNKIYEESKIIKKQYNYDDIIFINISRCKPYPCHIMYLFSKELDIKLNHDELYTDFYYPENKAELIIKTLNLPKKYAYVQLKTSLKQKNITLNLINKYCKIQSEYIITMHSIFSCGKYPLYLEAHIMKKANEIFLPDSVMYHIANSLNIKINKVFFKGYNPYDSFDKFKPLHKNENNLVFIDLYKDFKTI